MFFIFSKILAFVITPVVWIVALLLLSLFARDSVRKKRFLLATLVLVLFFSNQFIFDECMRAWETEAIVLNDIDTSYDAGIVLGGMISYDERFDRLQFDRGSDRLMQAIELYKKGVIKKIIFTGGSGSILHPEAKEGLYAERFLLTIDIPKEDIILETESRNTHENAVFTKKIIDEKFSGGKFLLITSAFHMRRSVGCFEKERVAITPYSTDRFTGPRKFVFDNIFIPSVNALSGWSTLIHEITGYMIYKFTGYL